jgi:hypothetical protein
LTYIALLAAIGWMLWWTGRKAEQEGAAGWWWYSLRCAVLLGGAGTLALVGVDQKKGLCLAVLVVVYLHLTPPVLRRWRATEGERDSTDSSPVELVPGPPSSVLAARHARNERIAWVMLWCWIALASLPLVGYLTGTGPQ